MSRLILVDNTQIDIQNGFTVVDDAYEFTTSVTDYDALSQLSKKLNDDNLVEVKMTDQFGGEIIYSNFTVASPKFIIVNETDFDIQVIIRLKQKSEQEIQMDTVIEVVQQFNDEQALSVKSLYPKWDTLVGKKVKKGTKCVWYGRLYKTIQPDDFLVQKQYEPGAVGTESLYECIDEDHAGTYDDPIPYEGNMTLEKGKCYSQDGIIYMCINGSGIAVYDKLEYLRTFAVQYVYAAGTYEDPIQWMGSGIIEKDKYYVQNGKIYKATADSNIAVYGDLSALAAYVKEYTQGSEEEPQDTKGTTPEDPIEYNGGIALESNKYYIQDGVVYLCVTSTNGEVNSPLSELTDNVVKYEGEDSTDPDEGGETENPWKPGVTQPEPGESPENPIDWSIGSILYNGKYYRDNGVVYKCVRDSGIALYYNLADLISGGYVQVVK